MIQRAIAFALLLLAGCAMPPVDRYMLEGREEAPVRLEGAKGPLSEARSQQILDNLRKRSPETSIFDSHVAVEELVSDTPLVVGNKVTLLQDGSAAYPAMLAAIRGARHHIHMESYILEDDDSGRQFAAALIDKSRQGVEVRVIYDAFGSMDTPREFFDNLRSNGVQVVAFNPLTPLAFATFQVSQRDHRKLLVVDGRVAFVGGINISDVYSGGSRKGRSDKPFDKRPWRDTQAQVEGPAVADLERAFLDTWSRETKRTLEAGNYIPQLKPAGTEIVRAIAGSPGNAVNAIYITLVSAIASAESEVHITAAYFVPDPQLLAALEGAARRGVDVKLILPSRTDFWAVFHAGRSFYEELLEAGVKIFERKTRLLHAKTAVIDGVWSTVGSSNLDWQSLLHNDEINVVVLGPEFGRQMDAMFATDLANSDEITLDEWHRRPIRDRVREAAARAWAYLL